MGRRSFENYGVLASKVEDCTVLAGRYSFQKSSERNILHDILAKLDLRPEHSLLDIGCNAGNLTIPLSFMVAGTTGLDHPECLRRLREKFPNGIELVSGNFLDVPLSRPFDRILCYSVLHYLRSADEVYKFMDKTARLPHCPPPPVSARLAGMDAGGVRWGRCTWNRSPAAWGSAGHAAGSSCDFVL